VRKLRILQAFDIFNIPHGGGTVDIIYRLTRELSSRGHRVALCFGEHELDEDLAIQADANLVNLRSYFNKHGVYLMPGLFSLDVRQFDVIHLHCYRSFMNAVLCSKAKRHGIPFIIDAHGSTVQSRTRKQMLHSLYDRAWGYSSLRNAAALVAETQTGVREFYRLGAHADKIRVIHPGLDIHEFDDLPERGLFRQKYGLDNQFVILFVGRLHHAKRVDLLVRTLKHLTDSNVNAHLVVVGPDGGHERYIRDTADLLNMADRVTFTGYLSGNDKLSAMVDADVLVQPSLNEAGARPSLEALLCGTPIAVQRGTGAGDMIDSFTDGYTLDCIHQLFGYLYTMSCDNGASRKAVEPYREWVRNNMGFDKKADEYEKVYEEALSCKS